MEEGGARSGRAPPSGPKPGSVQAVAATERTVRRCAACRALLDCTARSDALYCCSSCRQRQYRRRLARVEPVGVPLEIEDVTNEYADLLPGRWQKSSVFVITYPSHDAMCFQCTSEVDSGFRLAVYDRLVGFWCSEDCMLDFMHAERA